MRKLHIIAAATVQGNCPDAITSSNMTAKIGSSSKECDMRITTTGAAAVLATLLGGCTLAGEPEIAADEAAGQASPAPLVRAEAPVRIDGVLDDPVWQTAAPVRADYIKSKVGVLSDQPRMTARYAWDEDYLYIAYETFDANLIAGGTHEMQGPVGNRREGADIHKVRNVDVVEFFVAFAGDEHFFWEIHHNAHNQFNDVFIVVPDKDWRVAESAMVRYNILLAAEEYVKDNGAETVKFARKLKVKADGEPSTVNDRSDVDTGYTAEIRLPLGSIGAPREARTRRRNDEGRRIPGPWNLSGREVAILAVVQDGDLEERYHHSSPTGKIVWFHHAVSDYPVYQFTGEK